VFFWIKGVASANLQILVRVMEKLSMPLDRAHRVMLGTHIGAFGTHPWTNMVLTSLTCFNEIYFVLFYIYSPPRQGCHLMKSEKRKVHTKNPEKSGMRN
jgi:hypothetical protein